MDLRQHNLIAILQSISLEEFKNFKKFIYSPYYNNLEKIKQLFHILKQFYPEFSAENLNTKEIFKKLYPDRKYNHSTITNLISKTQKLAEEYLITINLQKNSFKKNEFLLKEYFGRNLKQLSNKIIFTAEEPSQDAIDANFFFSNYNNYIYKVNYIVNYGMNNQKKSNHIFSDSLLKGNINFINYFVMELMSNYINSVIVLSSVDTQGFKPKFDKIISDLNIETLIKNIEPFNKYGHIVNLYLKLIKTFSDLDNLENYFTYKKEIFKTLDKLYKDDLYFHYSKMISYCSLRKGKNVNFDFQREIFELCEIVLENEYYINSTSKFLQINLYKIIINSAIALKKYGWLKEFIHIYSKKVNPRLQKDAENFGLANLNFATGNYNECLTNLNNIRENVFLLEIRAMKLIIFYNLSYYNEGLNDLKSFQKFIKINKSLTQQRRQTLINFLTYMDKLFLYKVSNRKSDIGYYRKKLTIEENCLYKDWLIKTYQKIK
jgi:hypothetical protein